MLPRLFGPALLSPWYQIAPRIAYGATGAIMQRRHAALLCDGENADVRELRLGDFLLRVLCAFHGHLHVRLPTRDPHFADRDVLNGERVLAGDGHVHSRTGLETFELRAPF